MSEQRLQEQLRRWFAANEPDSRAIPSFHSTLQSARRRLEPAQSRGFWPGWALTAAGMAAIAVLALLATRAPGPSLQDDIRLAQSLSFEAVWRSPSDSLLALSPPALLRDTPAMPRAGEPQFSTPSTTEYL